jgi:hypothetical protein
MDEKGKVPAELSYEKWRWGFALLCDMKHHAKGLNTKRELIPGTFWAVTAFQMKLTLIRKQFGSVNPSFFFLRMGSVRDPFPDVRAVEMIESFTENFSMRFGVLCSHAANKHVLENPFAVDVSDAVEKLQLEFIELQYDSV